MTVENGTLPPADRLRAAAAYLSDAAYLTDSQSVTNYLNSIPSTFGTWTLQWGPSESVLYNSFFIASNEANQYVVALQGTIASIANFLEDGAAMEWTWPYPDSAGAMCALGTYTAFDLLTWLTGGPSSQYMIDFLNDQHPNGITVTGHSLGGGLANLMAVYLAQKLGYWTAISSITFAAPTLTDTKFLALLTEATKNGVSEQWQNQSDIIPMAWDNYSSILASFVNGPQMKSWEEGILYDTISELLARGDLPANYIQLPKVHRFPGPGMSGDSDWETEIWKQHSVENVYMREVIPQFKPLPLREQPEYLRRKRLLEKMGSRIGKTLASLEVAT